MPKFAANIGWLAQEVPMLERFQLVRDRLSILFLVLP